MDLGRYLVERHLREGTPVAELAAAHGVHRSWLYKLLARYRAGGDAGLEARSRRPHRSPTRISDQFENEIVALRKRLDTAGFDAGAQTIHTHLARSHPNPSEQEVRESLEGNLCRCTGYHNIVKSIITGAKAMGGKL